MVFIMVLLTQAKINNAKPKAKPYKISDGKGLYLYVVPKGGKYWRLNYLFVGKQKTLALGVYPLVTLQMARDAVMQAKRQLQQGTDPGVFKKNQKQHAAFINDNTFEAVAREWYNLNATKWSKSHANKVMLRMLPNVFPVLGKAPIADITAVAFLNCVRRIEQRGAIDMAHRVTQICRQVFTYAVITGRISHNPIADLRGALQSRKAKNYPTLKPDEFGEFWHRLLAIKSPNKHAIMLLAYTFVRPGEMRQARWQDFDFKNKIWVIPPEINKMGDAHHVPLSRQVLAILADLRKTRGNSDFVFPSVSNWRRAISDATLNKIIKICGYHGRLVAHGFRAFASTALNEQGYNADVIERQLGHKPRNKVRAAYNRAEYLPQRVTLMQDYADYLDALTKA